MDAKKVLSTAAGLILLLTLSSAGAQGGDPPGFVGAWETTDADGSRCTMEIYADTRAAETEGVALNEYGEWTGARPAAGGTEPTGPGTPFSVYLYDDGASACGVDDAERPLFAAVVKSVGYANGNTLDVPAGEIWCLSEPAYLLPFPFTWTFVYQPGSDSLEGGCGVPGSWTRSP